MSNNVSLSRDTVAGKYFISCNNSVFLLIMLTYVLLFDLFTGSFICTILRSMHTITALMGSIAAWLLSLLGCSFR